MTSAKIFLIPVVTATIFTTNATEETKPNIVLFLVDDMGWQDTSLPFGDQKTPLNERYRTPNMEKLAARGVKFTNAYACAVSSPTRVSLMTGMNAARHRVTNWTLELNKSPDNPPKNSGLNYLKNWNMNGISPAGTKFVEKTVQSKCLPQHLQEAGYTTIHCGKAHYGAKTTPAADPINLGFDINIAGWAGGGLGDYEGMKNFGNPSSQEHGAWGVPAMWEYCGKDIFITEALTQKALKNVSAIRKKDSQKPFFLYMAHYAVHCPIQADKRFQKNYPHIKNNIEKAYATMLEGMDKSLGDIMDYLDKEKLTDNTVIMFMSDNGGLSDHGRGEKAQSHNLPLRAGKGAIYEGGIRVPMIIAWKNHIKPNTIAKNPIIIEDFFPTILEIANAKKDKNQPCDGKSFVKFAKGKKAKKSDYERPLVWHYPNSWTQNHNDGYGPYSAIRVGDWKYIRFYEPKNPNPVRLYNLAKDIEENENLVNKDPKKAKELANKLQKILEERNAQLLTLKSTGETLKANP